MKRFDREWRSGNRDIARQIARLYVDQNRARLSDILASLSREDLVREVSALRNEGREEDRIIVDMWLLSEYDPVHVSGSIDLGAAPVDEAIRILAEGRKG